MKRILLALCLLAGIAAAYVWLGDDARRLLLGGAGEAAAEAKAPEEQAIAVSTAIAQKADFPIRRRAIGVMESPATVVVRSRIDSQIVKQHVTDGQIVHEGDLLFTLDDREVKAALARAEATLQRDLATKARADLDLDRARQLLAKHAAAKQQVDQAEAEAKAAAATVASDRAQVETEQLRLSYTEIRSPISGRIGAVRVTPGNLVSANDMSGQGLVTITQVRPIRVSFTLPEKDLGLVRSAYWRKPPAPRAMVHVLQPGSGKVLASAPLNFIDSVVDSASGTLTAKAMFDNDGYTLVPGQYVDVQIDLDVEPETVIIPSVALQTGPNGPFVFAVNDDSHIEVTPVTVLGTEGDMAAIESGLAADTPVVVEGQLKLEQGTLVAATPSKQDLAAGDSLGALRDRRGKALADRAGEAETRAQ